MSENTLEKNFEIYKNGLIKIIGEESTDLLIESLGGEEKIMRASYATTRNTGLAYEGSFIQNIIRLAKYANAINDLLPEDKRVEKKSINKICLLSQIAKVIFFEENDNNWEVTNRGIVYKYAKLNGALRIGERSLLISMNANIKFDEFEFEAMQILDKKDDNDNFTKYYSSTLSVIIKEAAEIITLINRVE